MQSSQGHRHQKPVLDAGLSEIARFLARRRPFHELAMDELAMLAAQATIEFHLAGATILSEDGGPVTFLRVVHSGGVDISHEGKLLDLLGPGDTFGHAAMLSGLPPGFEARAAEDTLCYRIPVSAARPLLDHARSRELKVGLQEPGLEPVAKLIRSPTVTCGPEEEIGAVARRMTEVGANSAVVQLAGGGIGIVTDRDLRTRVLAAGHSGEAAVVSVMSTPVFAVAPDRLGGEVLYEMLERGVRHAPVLSARGALIGVVEDADLFAAQPRSWFWTRRTIARAASIEELAEVSEQLPSLMLALHRSSLRALDVARVLSALVDALIVRVLELSCRGVELPGDGLVWLAVGSQARRELTMASRSRGALIADEAPPEPWRLAAGAGLQRCGLGGQMPARTSEEWSRGVTDDDLALSVLSDRRPLWGTPREPLPLPPGEHHAHVLNALHASVLAHSLPSGFDMDAVLGLDGSRSERLDVRLAAILPIASIACWAANAAGAGEGSTLERLRAAADAGVLSQSGAGTLSEAFELAFELRIEHQMEQLAAGAPADDLLAPAELSPLTRGHLRDVFRAVGAVTRELRR